MYRYSVIFIIILVSFSGHAQSDSLYFSVSSYRMNRVLHNVDTVSIKKTEKAIDVYFYKEHFHEFYSLPKQLIKKKYKNQEIIEWSNPKDDTANWSDSYTYDAKGRLIEYKYSGCFICSQLPWGYTLSYDHNNNVIEQSTYYISFSSSPEEEIHLHPTEEIKDYTKLTYDSNGTIIVLEKYGTHGIKKKIERIN